MKFFLLSSLFLFTSAFAQTLEIEIQGIRHSCMPAGNVMGTKTCVDLAYKGAFSKDEALRLCEGSSSEMPAVCGIKAEDGSFTRAEAITLCLRAVSDGPADCAETAYRGPFTKEESIRLCSHPHATIQNTECALEAYRGSYSKEEAIRICHMPRKQLHRFKFMSLNASKDEMDELIKEANLKAFRLNEYK